MFLKEKAIENFDGMYSLCGQIQRKLNFVFLFEINLISFKIKTVQNSRYKK